MSEIPDVEGTPSLPPIDNTHLPNLAEVFERMQNGTLGEISDPALSQPGQQVVFTGRSQPDANDELFVSPEGIPVYPFARKFTAGFEGWQPGDIVRAKLRLTDGGDGVHLRTMAGDDRYDDIYTLSETDQARVRLLGLALLDANVQIDASGRYEISQIYTYPVTLSRVNAVEQIWDGETHIRPDEQVLAQGEVITYNYGKFGKYPAEYPGHLALRLATGRIIEAATTDFSVYLSRGNLDVIHPRQPQPGDIIQVHLSPNDRPFESGGLAELAAHKSAYLLQPSTERREIHDAQRADINERLGVLQNLEGENFRQAYGQLLRGHMEVRHRKYDSNATLLLSPKELDRLEQLRAGKFPPRIDEMPHPDDLVINPRHYTDINWVLNVERIFGIDALGMSNDEYFTFCLDLATRRISCGQDDGEVMSHPFANLERRTDAAQLLDMYRQGLEAWLPDASYKHRPRHLGAGQYEAFDSRIHITPAQDRVVYGLIAGLADLSKVSAAARAYVEELMPRLDDHWGDVIRFSAIFS